MSESLELFNEFKILYPEYFKQNNIYKFGSCDNFIIIFEKLFDTVTNESRNNIFNSNYAEYIADKLKVVFIVNKFNPKEFFKIVTHVEFCQSITYSVNEIITNKTGYRLHYYNSIEPAYFEDINLNNYSGLYMSWFDNGLLSEKGHYINGLRNGIWEFGLNTKPINNIQILRNETYVNGEVFKNNYQLIKIIPSIQSLLFNWLISIHTYVPIFNFKHTYWNKNSKSWFTY